MTDRVSNQSFTRTRGPRGISLPGPAYAWLWLMSPTAGRVVARSVCFAVAHGERVLVGGPNGSGKSTLLGALAGDVDPAEGPSSRRGGRSYRATRTGARSVDWLGLCFADRVRELTGLELASARAALAWFGLPSTAAERTDASLPPGKRTRVELTVIAHRRATCLLLDEPTNHLDIESVEVLEVAFERVGPARWLSQRAGSVTACDSTVSTGSEGRCERLMGGCGSRAAFPARRARAPLLAGRHWR